MRVPRTRQGMFTLSGAPSTTSHLDIYILFIFHYLGSPLNCTAIYDLMRNLFIYNACIYIHLMFYRLSYLSPSLWCTTNDCSMNVQLTASYRVVVAAVCIRRQSHIHQERLHVAALPRHRTFKNRRFNRSCWTVPQRFEHIGPIL